MVQASGFILFYQYVFILYIYILYLDVKNVIIF